MPPKKNSATFRGKEIATTAASGRARRSSAAPSRQAAEVPPATKKRGRPALTAESDGDDNGDGDEPAPHPKKRARALKKTAPKQSDAEDAPPLLPPKKRGRQSKAMKASSKAEAEDDNSAGADAFVPKGKRANMDPVIVTSDEENFDNPPCKYWLMKAEQEDRFETTKDGTEINTRFTIDDLRNKDEPEAWDGVRNVVAAKHLRAMSKGDLAFFYASGGKSGRKPGITGIMEIVSEAEPDPTVGDESSYGYVEKVADRKKWVIVKVAFRKKLSEPVTLKTLQSFRHSSGVLENMELFRQGRLSVSPVAPQEWSWIHQNLVKGYEEDDPADKASKNPAANAKKTTTRVEVPRRREHEVEANGVDAETA